MKRADGRRGAGGAERLLSVASRLFAAAGFAGTSVTDLLRAAHVTRPVLYYHFGSKEGLYLAAARRAASDYDASMGRAAGGVAAATDRIRRVCRAHAESGRERALLAAVNGSAATVAARVVEIVRALIVEGIERGEITACDPEDAALALVGLAEATGARDSRGASGPSEADRLDRVLSVVLRGLAPRSRRSSAGAGSHRGRR